MIEVAIRLSKGLLGFRTIAFVLMVIAPLLGAETAPHYTTVRQWIYRFGLQRLVEPVERADDWVILADESADISAVKCLAVLGVRLADIVEKDNFTLSREDMVPLALCPTKSMTGEGFLQVLEEVQIRTGHIHSILIDGGSNLQKGARLYQEKHGSVHILHDIKHKVALLMKTALENDADWKSYSTLLANTRQQVYQSDLAALLPPKQRSKARYMDIGDLIKWPMQLIEARKEGRLEWIPEERYQKYFGWLFDYSKALHRWACYVEGAATVCEITRCFGLSLAVHTYLAMKFRLSEWGSELSSDEQAFMENLLGAVEKEISKGEEQNETLLCSTEVLESVFGQYKELKSGHVSSGTNVVVISTFLGREFSREDVRNAMESCSWEQVCTWTDKNVPISLQKQRRVLHPVDRTKFDYNTKARSSG